MAHQTQDDHALVFRSPTADDGYLLHEFIHQLPPLAENSVYCNILQCSHFADTSVLAELNGELVGFAIGYLHPQKPNTYFLWQIGVQEKGRGCGLPLRMIQTALARPACKTVNAFEATTTPDNTAAQRVFQALAQAEGGECTVSSSYLAADQFGPTNDQREDLYTVKPLSTPGNAAES